MATASPATTDETSEAEIGVEAESAPRPQLPFLLSLTIAAVFPLAIGIGAASLKGAAAPVTDQVAIGHGEATVAADKQPRVIHPADRQIGDDLFRAGRFEAALHYYRSLGSADSLRLPGELSFRIALCREELGLWDEALAGFRSIASSAESSPLTAAATLGQARIWLRLKQPEQAVPLLRSLALRSHVPDRIAQEVSFLVPLALTAEMTSTSGAVAHHGADPRNDLVPVADCIEWPWETLLEGIDPERHHHGPPSEASEATHASSIAEEEPLAIARGDEDHEHSRTMIARTLGCLIAAAPKHRLADHARFALGRLAQADDDHAQAVTHYSPLVGRASSPLAIRAAYNAGVSYYRLGDLPRACEQLTIVVHGAPGHELHTQSTILLGCLLLDRGENREAAFQLQRAAGARIPPEDQALAAVYLGIAHLMQDQPREAAEALFADKPHFEDRSVRNAAAFLTALARYRLLTGVQQEREASFLFRSLVAIESDAEWLGPTGQLLIGKALHELGLADRMVELYSRSLEHQMPANIANEMKFAIAEQRHAEKKPEEARSLWQEVSADGEGVWQNRSCLRLAELALADGRADDCVAACRALHHSDGIPRTDVLKLMGRAYEQLGNDALAAQCYAGRMPHL
ncbi:MAG: tetratricopeptide repeat protein [Planctomycetota bacterium]